MYMTTQQAADTWCPMVRVTACDPDGGVSVGQPVFNRLQNGASTVAPDAGRCIADKCAMWRWHHSTLFHPDTGNLTMHGIDGRIEAKGYCGLAGTPSAGMAAHP